MHRCRWCDGEHLNEIERTSRIRVNNLSNQKSKIHVQFGLVSISHTARKWRRGEDIVDTSKQAISKWEGENVNFWWQFGIIGQTRWKKDQEQCAWPVHADLTSMPKSTFGNHVMWLHGGFQSRNQINSLLIVLWECTVLLEYLYFECSIYYRYQWQCHPR